MSDFSTIEVTRDPRGFATLWLSREDKNNAFNAQMIHELIKALDQLAEDASLRFLLLRGRGRHFSAGADLAWMQQSAQLDFNSNLDDAHELGELMYALHRLKAPTLAVVQGAAFGGALGLISCCDMAIGAEDAQLCLSEVRIGLAPAVISRSWSRPSANALPAATPSPPSVSAACGPANWACWPRCTRPASWTRRCKPGSTTCCSTARKHCAPARTCYVKWTTAN